FVDPPLTPLMVIRAVGAAVDGRRPHAAHVAIPLETVSPALVRAVVAAEDARFFEHGAVDWSAVDEARRHNAAHPGAPRGASTITMQCARNVFLWPGRSWVRKALEVALGSVLEVAWGKRRILEVYLNVIEWGDGVYGVEAAALAHF